MTPRDIVARAYALSGLIGEGDIPTSGEVTTGFHELNNIVDELRAVSLWVPQRASVTYTPIEVKQVYSIGRIPMESFLFETFQMPQPFLVQLFASTDFTPGDDISIYSYADTLTSKAQTVSDSVVSFINPLRPTIISNVAEGAIYFDAGEIILGMTSTSGYSPGDDVIYTDSLSFGYSGVITAIDPGVSITTTLVSLTTLTPTSSVYTEGPGVIYLAADNITPNIPRGIVYPEGLIPLDDLTVPDIVIETDPEYLYSLKYIDSSTIKVVAQVSDADWGMTRLSQTASTYPHQYRYHVQLPTCEIEFARPYSALNYPLVIEYPKHLHAFDSLDDTLLLRPGYSGYLEAQLAVNLLISSVTQNPNLEKLANIRYKRLQQQNYRTPSTAVLPTISTKSYYNYKDDSFTSR